MVSIFSFLEVTFFLKVYRRNSVFLSFDIIPRRLQYNAHNLWRLIEPNSVHFLSLCFFFIEQLKSNFLVNREFWKLLLIFHRIQERLNSYLRKSPFSSRNFYKRLCKLGSICSAHVLPTLYFHTIICI